jgi:hypothetical protein
MTRKVFQGTELAQSDGQSDTDAIWVELQRLGWTIDPGRDYLLQTDGKRSRQPLTPIEITDFLQETSSRIRKIGRLICIQPLEAGF